MNNQLATEANAFASSEASGFPLYPIFESTRSNVFKFGGHFEIGSTNKFIYANDGSDFSVSIDEGSYNYLTLAAKIETQMNLISSNWVCSYNVLTNKFILNRTTGTKILRVSQSNNAIWDTIGFIGSIDEIAPDEADVARIHTSEYIEIDLGTSANQIGFIGAIGAMDELFSISNAAVVTIKGHNVLDDWATPAFSKVWEYNQAGIMQFLDDDVGTDTGYRYWRLEIVDRTNSLGPEGITFSHFHIGTYLTLNNRNVNTGFSKEIIDPSLEQTSEDGTQYFSRRTKYLSITGTSINYMDSGDREEMELLYQNFGKHKPLFVSLDPTLCISADISEMTRFMGFTEVPRFEHFRQNIYSMIFQMREAI